MKTYILAALIAAIVTILVLPHSNHNRTNITKIQTPHPQKEKHVFAPPAHGDEAKGEKLGNYVAYKHVEDAPQWTIRYGEEFWRTPPEPSPGSLPTVKGNVPASFNVHDIIGRVSHAILREGEALISHGQGYVARFEHDGFALSPKRLVGTLQEREGDNVATYPITKIEPVELHFRTRAIRSGDDTLYAGDAAGEWSVTGDTSQRQLNAEAGLIEHYESTEKGIEVTWVLNRPPSVSAPLTLESEVSGLAFLERDEKGLLFGDKASGDAKVRVSNVIIVDSAGTRTPLSLNVNRESLSVEIPPSVLASAQFPIAIDPTFGPAFPIIYSPAAGIQSKPAVAGNGTTYLVAWESDIDPGASITDIRATRVTSAGDVLDPAGLMIGAGHVPRVASCAGDWFVVFQKGTVDEGTGVDIYGALVSSGGVVSAPVPISTSLDDQKDPDIAASGTEYFVVWIQNGTSVERIYGTRVTTSGTVISQGGLPIYDQPGYTLRPRIASDGMNFMVVWTEGVFSPNAGVWSIRVGAPSGSEQLVRANAFAGAVAWCSTGNNYLVSFTEAEGSDNQVKGASLNSNGDIQVSGFPIQVIAGLDAGWYNEVACNGAEFLSVANFGGSIYGMRVAANLTLPDPRLDASPFPVSNDGFVGDVSAIGANYLVAFERGNAPNSDIFGALVVPSGSLSDGTRVPLAVPLSTDGTISPSAQYIAAAAGPAPGGTYGYFVAWQDSRNGNPDVYGTIVSSGGIVLQPSGINICDAPGVQSFVSVAVGPTRFFVAWQDNRTGAPGVYGTRIDTGTGAVLDPPDPALPKGMLIQAGSNSGVDVAADDGQGHTTFTTYLVTWANNDILAKRVSDGTGGVLDPTPITICAAANGQFLPNAIYSHGSWLVVWADFRSGSDVYGRRVATSDGTLMDELNGFPISANPGFSEHYPRVATNGTDYLVVWVDSRNSSSSGLDIYGALLNGSDPHIVIAPNIEICRSPGDQLIPAVTSDGVGFLVGWTTLNSSGLFVNELDGSGSVPNNTGFVVDSTATSGNTPSGRPAITSVLNGYMTAYRRNGSVYSRLITTP